VRLPQCGLSSHVAIDCVHRNPHAYLDAKNLHWLPLPEILQRIENTFNQERMPADDPGF
jgi:hypothetical protein